MRRWICLAALLVLMTTLTGCFDYEIHLDLKEDGSGDYSVRLVVPKALSAMAPQRLFHYVVLPMGDRGEEDVNPGRVAVVNRTHFNFLDEVALNGAKFEIRRDRLGLVGIADDTYLLTAWIEGREGGMVDRNLIPGLTQEADDAPRTVAQEKARQHRLRALAGHFVSLVLNLPGEVRDAEPLILGRDVVEPEVGENRVAWRIPLAVLISNQINKTLVCKARFKCDLTFRVDRQSDMSSRFATELDRADRKKLNQEKALQEQKQ